jgi:hypothetical protein
MDTLSRDIVSTKSSANRIIVSLHGEPQPQFEHPLARTTQEAIQ